MPYIKKKDRKYLLEGWNKMKTPGDLNYIISFTINEYLKDKPTSYASFNDVLGALTGAKEEFYRRVVVPYEEKKMKENGDVYDVQ